MKYAQGILVSAIGVISLAWALYVATPTAVFEKLVAAPVWLFGAVMALSLLNLFNVAFRLWRFSAHCGVRVDGLQALRGSVAGNVLSLVFIPLIAQVVGRHAVMQKAGVAAITTATITGYERIMVGAVSAALATGSAVYLSGHQQVWDLVQQLALPQVALVLATAALIWIGTPDAGNRPTKLVRVLSSASRGTMPALEAIVLTLISLSLMIAMFALVFSWAAPQLTMAQLLACGAIVSFAASLPLNVGGWGPREAASVMALSSLGGDPAWALAASAVAGFGSSIAVVLMVPVSFMVGSSTKAASGSPRLNGRRQPATARFETGPDELRQHVTIWLGVATFVAVFFQVQTSTVMGFKIALNINLGDPFAVLSLATVGLMCWQSGQLPRWRVTQFNTLLLIWSVVLSIGLIVGISSFGVTPWAVGNKLMGWIVLTGYVAAAYLLVSAGGRGMVHRAILRNL